MAGSFFVAARGVLAGDIRNLPAAAYLLAPIHLSIHIRMQAIH
jgi:hypothetical protein